MFRTLGRELDEDIEYGFQAGGMQPFEDKLQWDILSDIVAEQRKSGVDIRMISREEARRIEPQLSKDIYGALYSPTGWQGQSAQAYHGICARSQVFGGKCSRPETEVTGFLVENGAVKGVQHEPWGELSCRCGSQCLRCMGRKSRKACRV